MRTRIYNDTIDFLKGIKTTPNGRKIGYASGTISEAKKRLKKIITDYDVVKFEARISEVLIADLLAQKFNTVYLNLGKDSDITVYKNGSEINIEVKMCKNKIKFKHEFENFRVLKRFHCPINFLNAGGYLQNHNIITKTVFQFDYENDIWEAYYGFACLDNKEYIIDTNGGHVYLDTGREIVSETKLINSSTWDEVENYIIEQGASHG